MRSAYKQKNPTISNVKSLDLNGPPDTFSLEQFFPLRHPQFFLHTSFKPYFFSYIVSAALYSISKNCPAVGRWSSGYPANTCTFPGQFSMPALPSCEQRSPQPSKHDQKLPPQADKLPSARLATGQAWCKSASYTAGEYNNHSLCEWYPEGAASGQIVYQSF